MPVFYHKNKTFFILYFIKNPLTKYKCYNIQKSLPIKQILISADRLTVDSFESYFNYLQKNKSFYVAYLGISTNGNITTDLMNTFIHTVNIAKSEYVHYMMIFLMAGLKSIAYNWLTDGCKTSSHTLAQIAFKPYQSLLDR